MQKDILIVYHSQGGTMASLAQRFARGAAREEEVEVTLRRAGEASLNDLLRCRAIAIGSPEYFGTMAGMIKDFFDRTYIEAQERTIGLPFVLLVCAGNDGRGAIAQIERIATGIAAKLEELTKATCMPGPAPRKNFSGLSPCASSSALYTTTMWKAQAAYRATTNLPSGSSCSKP